MKQPTRPPACPDLPADVCQILDNSAGTLSLALAGRLDASTTTLLWHRLIQLTEAAAPQLLRIEAANITYCDGAGIGLLMELARRQLKRQGQFSLNGLNDDINRLWSLYRPENFLEIQSSRAHPCCLPEEAGRLAIQVGHGLLDMIRFGGELTLALLHAARHPRSIRWPEVWLVMEKAGVNALFIVGLISFLIGLIMAFQATIPMRQFGVEIYVANLTALSMLRELGPLMTALLLAGRTSSAFAAELGTMKINEEIDALNTMGLAPIPFLVVTRVLATIIVMPLLSLFANLMGLVGGAVVLLSLGYPLVTYTNQVKSAVGLLDLTGGLAKTLIFALIVAGVGCLYGLKTRSGASAVGDSATRAVVSGIILIVIADGLFAVVYYFLGI
jgi:phospholipid/cholesterol/gamma-HCH transport system permease protein